MQQVTIEALKGPAVHLDSEVVAFRAQFAETIGSTRAEPDFVAHVQRTVATDPEAKWVFVVDNLNVHASLVEWLAEINE